MNARPDNCETGIRIGRGTFVPEVYKEMTREQLEETLISEIRLKNSMQEFIIKENLLEDFDIWMENGGGGKITP